MVVLQELGDKDREYKILTDYHLKRHDEIVKAGWILIEIPFLLVYNKEYIKELLLFIKDKKPISNNYSVNSSNYVDTHSYTYIKNFSEME